MNSVEQAFLEAETHIAPTLSDPINAWCAERSPMSVSIALLEGAYTALLMGTPVGTPELRKQGFLEIAAFIAEQFEKRLKELIPPDNVASFSEWKILLRPQERPPQGK